MPDDGHTEDHTVTMLAALLIGLAIVIGFGYFLTLRWLAHPLGMLDRPDGRRKIHRKPVAVVGGIALFGTTVTTLLIGLVVAPSLREVFAEQPTQAVWLLASCGVIILVGVLDDLKNLRARFKLAGQLFAISLAVFGGGYVIERVSLFGHPLDFGVFAVPVTFLWFLAAVNAINLLDGMDGMLGTLGLVICGSLGVMSVASGHPFSAVVAFAMTGGLIAFLWFNKPPASVYMGDAGSMLIGLVVAALSIRSSLKGPAVAILAPVGLLVLPFLDTSAAIVRRKLTGRGLAVPDRGHLHHLLLNRGWSITRSLAVVGTLGLIAAGGAVASTYYGNDLIAVLSALSVVVLLLLRGLFGVAEARLLAKRAVSALSSTVTRPKEVELEVRLQGSAEWDDMWNEIAGRAATLHLTAVYLDVNAPLWHEGYHRRWQVRGHTPDHLTGWRVDLPIIGHGQVVGRMTVFGDRGDTCIADKLTELSQFARRVELLADTAMLPYIRPQAVHVAEAHSDSSIFPRPVAQTA